MKLAIAGASGRMGRMLIEAALAAPDLTLTVALDARGSALVGTDAGAGLGRQTGVMVTADVQDLGRAEVLIDFTRPDATLAHLKVCEAKGIKVVIGTTGFDAAGKARIAEAAQQTALVFSPNMSVGVNATFKLLEVAARMLGDDYDVEIIEAHHMHKVDAPSGTALAMGEIIAGARGHTLADVAVYAREGLTGGRKLGAIGFASIRGGDIVGDHTVLFAGAGERIEITHRSSSRMNYAVGSLRAARFLRDKPRGMFTMADVLGIK